MGMIRHRLPLVSSPEKTVPSGTGQLVTGLVLMLFFWILDAIIDTQIFTDGSFSDSLFNPSSHEYADRALVILLACSFLLYSGRLSRVRSSLERSLKDAVVTAEREKAKVIAIVEAMGDAISIQDPEFKVLYQNRAHQELMGPHTGERCYQAYRDLSEICRDCHLVDAFGDGAVHRAEMYMQRSRGNRWVEVMASPLRDPQGEIIAGIQVMRDVTDRKLAEQAVTQEAALLQHLIDTIPSPIYHLDLSGRILWCNSAFAAWLAKPRELLVGRSAAEMVPADLCASLAPCEGGEGTVRETALRCGDGELREVILYRSMFRDENAERGVVGVMVDITGRKRAEQEVVGLNAALMQQAMELNQANRDLKAFSHAISHDLRTPLTRIYSSGQALEEYARHLDSNGRFFVKSVNDGCVQVEGLLDALLALSRVTEVNLATEPVDLSRLAREKATELQRLEPWRRVSFRISPLLLVQGDPKLLFIAMENLIDNAWKYTSRVPDPLIEFGSFVSVEGETVFFLRDNGAGFDSSRADLLFKPFQRLHSPQEFPGTGLGLATVRRIILRHNGRLWSEGSPGRGATFYFTVGG